MKLSRFTLHSALLLWAVFLSIIVAVLVLSQIGIGDIDPDKVCSLQFPKWIGCAMAAHENLAGGLIAAAGALFAGWWAWTAVREQTAIQRLELAEAERRECEGRLSERQTELADIEARLSHLGHPVPRVESLGCELEVIPPSSMLASSAGNHRG